MQITKKYFSRFKESLTEMPNLVESQIVSFNILIEKGIGEVLKEFSPIKDYAGKKFELSFSGFELSRPKYDEHYAKSNKLSYEGQIKVKVKLHNKLLDSTKEQEMFLLEVDFEPYISTFVPDNLSEEEKEVFTGIVI